MLLPELLLVTTSVPSVTNFLVASCMARSEYWAPGLATGDLISSLLNFGKMLNDRIIFARRVELTFDVMLINFLLDCECKRVVISTFLYPIGSRGVCQAPYGGVHSPGVVCVVFHPVYGIGLQVQPCHQVDDRVLQKSRSSCLSCE